MVGNSSISAGGGLTLGTTTFCCCCCCCCLVLFACWIVRGSEGADDMLGELNEAGRENTEPIDGDDDDDGNGCSRGESVGSESDSVSHGSGGFCSCRSSCRSSCRRCCRFRELALTYPSWLPPAAMAWW